MERLNRFVPVILAVIFIGMGYAWMVSERGRNADSLYWATCNARWGDATSQRAKILNDAVEYEAFRDGQRDKAMSTLVNNRNKDTAVTAQAVHDWNVANRKKRRASALLDKARKDYPPPLEKNYCTRLKSVKLPKAKGK